MRATTSLNRILLLSGVADGRCQNRRNPLISTTVALEDMWEHTLPTLDAPPNSALLDATNTAVPFTPAFAATPLVRSAPAAAPTLGARDTRRSVSQDALVSRHDQVRTVIPQVRG